MIDPRQLTALTTPEEVGAAPAPTRGASFGRFLVLGSLGAGGMGLVLSAYDPHLDRKVALKILRGEVTPRLESESRRASLVREAQAMARLQHPNVVTVYELGFFDDTAYLVMEQVDGQTLRAWLAERQRGWADVADALVQAGRGLAAAHRAGIVHRDVKPDNILVGEDGRTRISDFGLASASAATGTVVGTRGYLAPEQQPGVNGDARADQFAFCVSFWEALHGERPTAGVEAPRERKAPVWIYRALVRGLARQPEARWPSMDGLLDKLARRPVPPWKTLVVVGSLAVLGLAGTWEVTRPRPGDPCAGAAARLAGVWDTPRQEAVRAAFAATALPYQERTWQRVSTRLDDYAAGWVDMQGEACRATRTEGRQSDTLMDLRMACLERRRAVLGDLTELWSQGVDAETLVAAPDAAGRLAPLAECADARALTERSPLPSDPAQSARVVANHAHLDSVQALILAHHLSAAKPAAAAVRAEADATGWPLARAEAAFAQGDIESQLYDPAAQPFFVEAAQLAGEAHDDRLAARALIELVKSLAHNDRNPERALFVADLAEGVVRRAGYDPASCAQLLTARGEALRSSGKTEASRPVYAAANVCAAVAGGSAGYDRGKFLGELALIASMEGDDRLAGEIAEENLATTTALYGEQDPRVTAILRRLGFSYLTAGDPARSRELFRRALANAEAEGGAETELAAGLLTDVGITEMLLGNLDEATRLHERALQIRLRVFGPDHPNVAMSLGNLGEVNRKQGHFDEALELFHRMLVMDTSGQGTVVVEQGNAFEDTGLVLEAEADWAGALEQHQRALDVFKQALGPDHPDTLEVTISVARSLARLNRCDEARPRLSAALAGFEKRSGPEDLDVAMALTATAECDLAAGKAAEVVAGLERALAIEEKTFAFAAVERGKTRWLYARGLLALGRHADAIAAAQKAEGELAANAEGAHDRADAQAWLVAHR